MHDLRSTGINTLLVKVACIVALGPTRPLGFCSDPFAGTENRSVKRTKNRIGQGMGYECRSGEKLADGRIIRGLHVSGCRRLGQSADAGGLGRLFPFRISKETLP